MLYLNNLFHESPLDKRFAKSNYKLLLSMTCKYPNETIEQFTARFYHLLSKLEETEYGSIIQDPYYTRKYYIQALPSPMFEDLKKQALVDQVLPDDWKDITNPSEFIMAAANYIIKQSSLTPPITPKQPGKSTVPGDGKQPVPQHWRHPTPTKETH